MKSLQMAANYLQGCDAVMAVYDITRQQVCWCLAANPLPRMMFSLLYVLPDCLIPAVSILKRDAAPKFVG